MSGLQVQPGQPPPIHANVREEYEAQAQRAKRLVWTWSAVEIIVSAVLGAFAPQVFNDKQVAQVLSVGIPFVGIVLAVSYLVFEWHIDAVMQRELKALDLLGDEWRQEIEAAYAGAIVTAVRQETEALRALLPFANSYFQSAEKDRYGHRNTILTRALQQLDALDKGEIELEDSAYYEWLRHRLVDDRPDHVQAISRRPLDVYHLDPREINFIKNNEDAAIQGTRVTRIFLANEVDLCHGQDRAVLRRQFAALGVTCYVVWERRLPSSTLNVLSGGGLSIYDDEHLFFDRSYLERTVGEASGAQMADAPLRPRATVYEKRHPKFRDLSSVFDNLLNDHVLPAHRTMDNAEVFKDLLQELGRFFAGRQDMASTCDSFRKEIEDIEANGL